MPPSGASGLVAGKQFPICEGHGTCTQIRDYERRHDPWTNVKLTGRRQQTERASGVAQWPRHPMTVRLHAPIRSTCVGRGL